MYSDKLQTYEYSVPCIQGRLPQAEDYVFQYAKQRGGDGLDLGAGPMGVFSKYFQKCSNLDGCDIQADIIDTLPPKYNKKFVYILGGDEPLPYPEGSKDFVILSCVIQHLPNEEALIKGLKEVHRILKKGGQMLLIYKAGVHDTLMTHFNPTYKYERTFRMFDPRKIEPILNNLQFQMVENELFTDSYFITYGRHVVRKI